jgi:hypothetical protein
MSQLTIRYEPAPDDDVGRLWFEVNTMSFSGTGFFWSNLSEMPDLIRSLGRYPLHEPVVGRWGYNSMLDSDLVLSLRITQVDKRGLLEAKIEVADLFDLSRRLTASLNTDYASIERLSTDLAAITAQRTGEAILAGTERVR